MLDRGQADLSRHFGGRPSATIHPRFHTLGAVSVLTGSMINLACTLETHSEGGDHSIFTGRVLAIHVEPGQPLIHYDGHYHRLVAPEDSP